ncbi:MAG: hypothetical protein IJA41_06925 [Clostridia bacterium]|nr:hypothetical protein [Clostridia bacterium]
MLNIKRFLGFLSVWLCGVPVFCYYFILFDDVTYGLVGYIFAAAMILSQIIIAVVPKFAQKPRKLLYISLAVLYIFVPVILNLYYLEPFIFVISYILFLPICLVLYILNVFEIWLVVRSEKGDNDI